MLRLASLLLFTGCLTGRAAVGPTYADGRGGADVGLTIGAGGVLLGVLGGAREPSAAVAVLAVTLATVSVLGVVLAARGLGADTVSSVSSATVRDHRGEASE